MIWTMPEEFFQKALRCWFWSKNLHFQKKLGRNFIAVEGVISNNARTNCLLFSILEMLVTGSDCFHVISDCFGSFSRDFILHRIKTLVAGLLWRGFISSWIRTFVEKYFHSLFSKKKYLKSGVVPSSQSWSWGQLPPQRKTFPTRLLGLSKIWRYGRSWTHI